MPPARPRHAASYSTVRWGRRRALGKAHGGAAHTACGGCEVLPRQRPGGRRKVSWVGPRQVRIPTLYFLLPIPYFLPLTPCFLFPYFPTSLLPYFLLPTSYFVFPTSLFVIPTCYYLLLASYCLLLTTYYLLLPASRVPLPTYNSLLTHFWGEWHASGLYLSAMGAHSSLGAHI